MTDLNRRETVSTNALAAVLFLDAIYNVVPNKRIDADLEHLQVPRQLRFVLAAAKGSGAVGLMLKGRSPRLSCLAAKGLVLYFTLAIGAHVRIRDEARRYGLATVLLGWSALTMSRLSRAATNSGGDLSPPQFSSSPVNRVGRAPIGA